MSYMPTTASSAAASSTYGSHNFSNTFNTNFANSNTSITPTLQQTVAAAATAAPASCNSSVSSFGNRNIANTQVNKSTYSSLAPMATGFVSNSSNNNKSRMASSEQDHSSALYPSKPATNRFTVLFRQLDKENTNLLTPMIAR